LPAGHRSDRLELALVDCAPRVLVIDPATAHGARPDVLRRVPHVFIAQRSGSQLDGPRLGRPLEPALAASPTSPLGEDVSSEELAAVVYTSGSTGRPRGVMLSHRNFLANARSIVQYLALTARDRVLCVLPLYYVYGLSLLHTHLMAGGSVVLENRGAFPTLILDSMERHQVTGFAGVPSTFALLLHRSSFDGLSLPRLRYVTQAGGAMPPTLIAEWLARGPQVPFYVMYGATEAAARLTYLAPADLRHKMGSIGRPIPNVDITVVTDDDRVASPGEVGELVARGENVGQGYWNDAAETAQRFTPLGYRTGDMGYADAEGFLFLVGRRHDMIKAGAHRVAPGEIEDVLHGHPAVLEAAVVGAPHPILGEAPIAFVVLRAPMLHPDRVLRGFCSTRLPSYKIPLRVVPRSTLPKLEGSGKLNRAALRSAASRLRVERAS
jgi:acyl-CoA synthetase (AMP-forming)/AMP-acid ligase II